MKISEKRNVISVSIKEFIQDYIYRIDLDAEYQREKVWDKEMQEKLIDSIVTNIDIPKLYLAKVKDSQFDYECVDGKQRITTLIEFFKPEENNNSPLFAQVAGRKFTWERLQKEVKDVAKFVETYKLDISILNNPDEETLRETFRRLQLGIRLNAGELLHSRMGNVRDFVFKEIGKNGLFFANTNIPDKRFTRELALAQIVYVSYYKAKSEDFVRARREDIEDFFGEQEKLSLQDENFVRIRKVLSKMDEAFGKDAGFIKSKAVAVSAYLFVEEKIENKETSDIPIFVKFFLKLLEAIKDEMGRLREYQAQKNTVILDQFQKYILSASVEPFSMRRRHNFLKVAFEKFKKNGEIITEWPKQETDKKKSKKEIKQSK